RRIYQPVAGRMANEVAVAAVRLGRVIATVEHGLLDKERKIRHCRLQVMVRQRANRSGRAGEQRMQRTLKTSRRTWLLLYVGRCGSLGEHRRRNLSTRIAVDTRRVDEKIAWDIFEHSFLGICHCRPPTYSF